MKYNSWEIQGDPAGPRRLRLFDGQGRLSLEVENPLNVNQIGQKIGKSRRQIYRYVEQGRLHPLGKFLGDWLFPAEEAEQGKNWIGRRKSRRLPPLLARHFPEYDLKGLDAQKDKILVIAKVLENGSTTDIRWLLKRYSTRDLRHFLAQEGNRLLSKKTLRFWCLYLKTPLPKPDWRNKNKEILWKA